MKEQPRFTSVKFPTNSHARIAYIEDNPLTNKDVSVLTYDKLGIKKETQLSYSKIDHLGNGYLELDTNNKPLKISKSDDSRISLDTFSLIEVPLYSTLGANSTVWYLPL